ncbi:MAG TPA: hypothetical protein GXX14_00105 [Clostridiaceae bacterium]|nr:hypothetical protein [Clostridiaceae bacterium]
MQYRNLKDKMSKRERVEAAMKLQETDRVPVYDILFNDAAIAYFTGKFAPAGEEGLKIKCQAIKEMLDMTRMADYGPFEPGEVELPDGFIELQERWATGGLVRRPFDDEKGAIEWLKKSINKLEKDIKNMEEKKTAEEFRSNFLKIINYIGDDTVVLHGQNGTGLDQLRYYLGFEMFSYISVDEPELISEFLDLYTEKEVRTIHAIADKKLSPCALTYGDIGGKGRLLHSPDWLRREFMPRLKKLNDAWHEHDIKCLFHSDGYVIDVIPDLIEAGIDGLNPVECVAGMDLKKVKEKFGDKIFIAGSIDISQLMSYGTPEEVREECQKAIEIGGNGYFIGSTTELNNGSKLKNILTMLEVAWGVKLEKRD